MIEIITCTPPPSAITLNFAGLNTKELLHQYLLDTLDYRYVTDDKTCLNCTDYLYSGDGFCARYASNMNMYFLVRFKLEHTPERIYLEFYLPYVGNYTTASADAINKLTTNTWIFWGGNYSNLANYKSAYGAFNVIRHGDRAYNVRSVANSSDNYFSNSIQWIGPNGKYTTQPFATPNANIYSYLLTTKNARIAPNNPNVPFDFRIHQPYQNSCDSGRTYSVPNINVYIRKIEFYF